MTNGVDELDMDSVKDVPNSGYWVEGKGNGEAMRKK